LAEARPSSWTDVFKPTILTPGCWKVWFNYGTSMECDENQRLIAGLLYSICRYDDRDRLQHMLESPHPRVGPG
jgi:hypothetical protein